MTKRIKLPKDEGAERAVVATVFVEPSLYEKARSLLSPEDFYDDRNQRLFKKLGEFLEEYAVEELDDITFKRFVGEELYGYLVSFIDEAVHESVFPHACRIVKEQSILRKVMLQEMKILREIEGTGDIEKLRELHEKALDEIRHLRSADEDPERWLREIALEYTEELAEPEWLVPDMIPKGSMTLITAKAGAGKTYLMYALIKNMIIEKEKVIYLDMDNSLAVINKRLKQSGLYRYTKPEGDRLIIVSRHDKRVFVGSDSWRKLKDALATLAEKGEHRVVIVDSLKNISKNYDMNSDKEAEAVMGELKDIMGMGHTLVIIHHVPKLLNPDLPFKNSGTILDHVEMAFSLDRDKETETIKLTCFKSRFDKEPVFHYHIDGEMNIAPAVDPRIAKEVNICRAILEVIGLGGKPKRQVSDEASKKLDIGEKKAREYLEKYEGLLWEIREEKGERRPRLAVYPKQGVNAQTVVAQLLGNSPKPESVSNRCGATFGQLGNIYIYKEKLPKSPKEEETILKIAEELIAVSGEIDLEIATVERVEDAPIVIGEDPQLKAVLFELWLANETGDPQRYRGMIEKLREGKISLSWAYETVKREEGEDDYELDF